ncbi:MAG TPA: hypothetical protein VEA69_19080 [Tepidisphaeraceae bacterium]|nr:hypothetical protein [Tepidisphaeraceae bacterium]
MTIPPPWFEAMSEARQKGVVWVDVAELAEHEACAFLPSREGAYALVLASVREFGVQYPLATASGRVLDGRYRLRAARELGLLKLPTLAVDVADPVRFVHEMKAAREHLTDLDRAALAVRYQDYKRGAYVIERTAKMNAARKGKGKPKIPVTNLGESPSPSGSRPPLHRRRNRPSRRLRPRSSTREERHAMRIRCPSERSARCASWPTSGATCSTKCFRERWPRTWR